MSWRNGQPKGKKSVNFSSNAMRRNDKLRSSKRWKWKRRKRRNIDRKFWLKKKPKNRPNLKIRGKKSLLYSKQKI